MEQFSTPQKMPIRTVLKEINSNEFVNKSGTAANGSIKSPLGLDSDISGIDADTTLSGLDSSLDTSYKIQNPNATFGDLLSGFGGLSLSTTQRLQKPHSHDTNNTLSSDDEIFQECENNFDTIEKIEQPEIDTSIIETVETFTNNAVDSASLNEPNDLKTPEITVILESEQNPLNNLNVTSDLVSTENGIQNDTQKSEEIGEAEPEPGSTEVQEEEPLNVTTDFSAKANETIQTESEVIPLNVTQNIMDEAKPMAENAANEIVQTESEVIPLNVTLESEQNPLNNLNVTSDLVSTENLIQNDTQGSEVISEAVPEPTEVHEEEPLNVTTDFSVKANETIQTELEVIPLNVTQNIVYEAKPTSAINQTFEAMDVDMNETVAIQQTTALNAVEESFLNQTVEMADIVQADEVAKPELNITMAMTTEPKSIPIDTTSPVLPVETIERELNVTQVINEDSITKVEMNQTIDISSLKMNVTPTNQDNDVNDTFVKPNSPSFKDFLSSTRNMDETIKMSPSLPNVNLNETVVVDNKLPSINTSFIIPPKLPEPNSKTVDVKEIEPETKDNTFKLPAKPTKATNPFDYKHSPAQFEVSDDEFQAPGLILNSNDFDFLLSRGNSSGQINPRDSILERFDPISGRKSIVPTPLIINKTEPAPVTANISTILEVESINEISRIDPDKSIEVVQQTPIINLNVTVNESGDNENLAKLESGENFEQINVGDGDNSQASSTTETYETASIGEPLKADVTMSVGLIHDLKMDNMKSLEQDKVEPHLKMNDEQKVKQEMVGDIERKLKEAEAREEALLRRITEKDKAMNKMNSVVETYEKTMVELISEREQLTQNYEKQLVQLKGERDANFHHLTSLENTFSDLHVKYEKSKQLAIEVKDSEAKLVEKLEFCQQQMKLQEQRYDKLKNHALSQLEGANAKLEALNKAHSNESKKLAAQLKKEEISRHSIMEQLAQKTKENDELVKICDELINNGADGS